jgi:hypothetical protein
VLDVACAVGFNDPSHFACMFRRYIGHTPSAYRRRKAPIRGTTGASHETGVGLTGGTQPGLVPTLGGSQRADLSGRQGQRAGNSAAGNRRLLRFPATTARVAAGRSPAPATPA